MASSPYPGPAKSSFHLHHIGIAVRSIDTARKFYEKLGLSIQRGEVIPHEQVRTAMLQTGEGTLELLEPTEPNSPIGRFLERRGEGIHHLALEVQDIEAAFRQLKDQGVRLVHQEVRAGADGHHYFFIHPSATGGVLLEILESREKQESSKKVE
jgi:LAO/AO transport system kinase